MANQPKAPFCPWSESVVGRWCTEPWLLCGPHRLGSVFEIAVRISLRSDDAGVDARTDPGDRGFWACLSGDSARSRAGIMMIDCMNGT